MKLQVKLITFAAILGIGSTFFYMRHNSSTAQNPSVIGRISEPIGIMAKASFQTLFSESDLIIEGKVIGFGSASWNGKTPASVEEWENSSSHVYHKVLIKTIKSFVGGKPGQIVGVVAAGGSPTASKLPMGNKMLITYAERHRFKVGDRGVFFLNSQSGVPWVSPDGKTNKKEAIRFSYGPDQAFGKLTSGKFNVLSKIFSPEEIQRSAARYETVRKDWYKKRCPESRKNPGCSLLEQS